MKTWAIVFILSVCAVPCPAADQNPGVLDSINDLAVLSTESVMFADERPQEFVGPPAEADEDSRLFPFRLSGEIRVREEYWHHFYGPDPNSDGRESFDYAHMRTRLRFDVDIEKDLTAVIELQDVRTWGEELTTTADTEGVDIKRSAFTVHNLCDEPLALEVGRYVMAYGDERLIGALEWVDQGRTYDGLRASYAPDEWYLDAFAVRVSDLAFDDSNDQDFYGVYTGRKPAREEPGLEGYALLLRDQRRLAGLPLNMTERRFVTLGTRIFGKSEEIDYTGEFAFQTGDAGPDDLFAYALVLTTGYTVPECPWQTRIGFELDHATGDQHATDSDSEQFQVLFPTNHIHYGYADLLAWSNMWDYRVGVSTRPDEEWTLSFDFHHMLLDDADGGWINAAGVPIRTTGGAKASRHLGDEIDLLAQWRATDHIHLLGGYSHFFTGGFVEDTAGGESDLDFVYLQARVTF